MRTTNDAYKPLWGLFAIILGVIAVTAISRSAGGKDNVPWRTDLGGAAIEAQQVGKPVLLYFTASWCGPCRQMAGETWANRDVDARLRASYVPVKIDIDAQRETALTYGIESIPTVVLLDAEGKVTRRASGYMEPDEFLAWLDGSNRI